MLHFDFEYCACLFSLTGIFSQHKERARRRVAPASALPTPEIEILCLRLVEEVMDCMVHGVGAL